MENDDKLKAFFKEHSQPLYRDEWFSRRVLHRLPEETKKKIRLIEIGVWSVSAVLALSICFSFGKTIIVIDDYRELFSIMTLFSLVALISALVILTDQIIKMFRI